MATAEIKELINQSAAYRPRLYFGGGEPFIREDFLEILAHANKLNLQTAFTTNGTLLNRTKIEKIVDLGIDTVNFSMDGDEDLHDKLRGAGNFRKAMSNLNDLLQYKSREKTNKPIIFVNITINPFTAGHLKEIIHSIRNITGDGIDFYRIHHLWFITPKELQAHRGEVRKVLGRQASGAAAHCLTHFRELDPAVLSDELAQLETDPKIVFLPGLQGQEIDAFYTDGSPWTKRCLAPFKAVLVKPNGDVKFCPDEWIDDYVLGNIREERFQAIWTNKKARHFRSVIFRKRSFPACKRCNWMHGF